MSRGNHERFVVVKQSTDRAAGYFIISRSENMNKMYGFEGEVKAKYSANMCDLFTEVYNWLPLCHLLNHKVGIVTEKV